MSASVCVGRRDAHAYLLAEEKVLMLIIDRLQPLILLTTIGVIGIAVCFSASFVNAQNFEKKVISSPDAPEAIGPYSQGIQVGKTVYLSGQIAIDPKTKQIAADASIEDQTRLALDNLKAVLVAAGLTMDHIVATTVYLKDVSEFAKMNAVYGTYFKNAPPARATVEVARLPREAKIEISAIAVAP
jgi:2-iminobutanoate/2-iminopropanoate deaminase